MEKNQRQDARVFHQTILTSRNTAPLFLLTLPRNELPTGDAETFPELIRWILRNTGPVIPHERWVDLWRRVENRHWHAIRLFPWWLPLSPEEETEWREEIERLREIFNQALEPTRFTRLLLEGTLSLPVRQLQLPLPIPFPLFGLKFRAWYTPLTYVHPVLLSMYYYLDLERHRQKLEVSEEEIVAWTVLTSVLARAGDRRISAVMEDFWGFEVPFATSREISKRKLEELISQARQIAFIPLVPAALEASNLIVQGQFILALEVVTVAGLSTVVLASTFSVAEWILDLPRRKSRHQ